MKKLLPLFALLFVVGFVGSKLRTPKNPGAFDVVGFGKLPILQNGRLKPLDTVARTTLLQIQGNQRVVAPDGRKLKPIEWLLDVTFRSELADTYQVFEIDNPDVLALFKFTSDQGRDGKRFAFNQLTGNLGELERQAKLANVVPAATRSPFQRGTLNLYSNVVSYIRLRSAFVPPNRPDFLNDLLKFQDNVESWRAAVSAMMDKKPHDEAAAAAAIEIAEPLGDMANVSANLLVIPPPPGVTDPTAWRPAGAALLETFRSFRVDASALAYAGFAHAWRNNRPEQFNKLLELYNADLQKRFAPQVEKAAVESRFNAADLFSTSFAIYAIACFVAMISWMVWPHALGRIAFWYIGIAFLLTTAGILTRMWLEGRPPVTNLYSSALFVGWGSVALCLFLEYSFRNAIGSAAAGLIGFGTLMIADRLHLQGDTLEMMQAVLDSNFWLATHVVVVAAGYSATFLAGFLAIIYIFRGLFTKTLDKATADSLARMVYGIICFATLFSFTGTVLGGIWADQSWGRFWGWDPKENGALIIVIWNAVILHARWGGMIKQRGLMCLAIGGNIATAWSWFGTNMLGVGLHSYGFQDAAFVALIAFAVSQVAIIGLANIPLEKWRSFKDGKARPLAPEHKEELAPAK
jgi:ABC-type transport system involved in cytochrome c biogenesis permease subunit